MLSSADLCKPCQRMVCGLGFAHSNAVKYSPPRKGIVVRLEKRLAAIRCESQLGQGATFIVELPAA